MKQEIFKNMLREKGLKVTNQRMLVLELMAERPGQHLTAEEIYDLARQECPEIGLATIYRTVQVLVDLSVIDKVSFDDGFARYELGAWIVSPDITTTTQFATDAETYFPSKAIYWIRWSRPFLTGQVFL